MIGAFVLLALGLLAYVAVAMIERYRNHRLKKRGDSGAQNQVSPWESLRLAIHAIEVPARGHSDDVRWSQFSSDVSLCLRRGVEIRTGKPVAERTTQEIERMLASGDLRLSVISEQEFKTLLLQLDAVRFGGQRISDEQALGLLESLRRAIETLEKDHQYSVSIPSSHKLPLDSKGGVRVFDS
jgi:hypothetical protein